MRHYSLSLENFRKYFPIYKARGYAVMFYIFPYVKRVLVELRKDNPDGAAKLPATAGSTATASGANMGRPSSLWIQSATRVIARFRSLADKLHFFVLRQALVLGRAQRPHLAARPDHQLSAFSPGANKYLFSMWAFREAGFFDILEEYCNFCIAYEAKIGYRCDLPSVGYSIARDTEAMLSYCWEGARL